MLSKDEYLAKRQAHEPDIDVLPWIDVHAVTPDARLSSKLDRGEAAALTLAVASQSRLILVDERRARGVAKQLGLNVTGSLGVLLIAKSQGLIPAVSPLVDQMIAQGRHISPRVRAEILKAAGEPAT